MAINTTELESATTYPEIINAEVGVLGNILVGGVLAVLFILAIALFNDKFGTRKAFLGASIMCTFLSLLAWANEWVGIPVITVFLILTLVSLIWLILGGDE